MGLWGLMRGRAGSGAGGDSGEVPAVGAASSGDSDSGSDSDSSAGAEGGGVRRRGGGEGGLAVGAEVQIHGLTGSMEHNGSRGHLLRHDAEKGRWEVQITIGERGRVLLLKPVNLQVVMADESWAAAGETSMAAPGQDRRLEVGAVVRVHSLLSVPEHNGACCILERLDTESGRWEARTVPESGKGKTLALKPANMTWMLSAADRAKGIRLQPPKGTE
jgi:hypothetical protein